MTNNVAFLTTIYPMPEHYLIRFFESLAAQDQTNWDLVIVNDGYSHVDQLLSRYAQLNVTVLNGVNNIVKNREIGINHILSVNYEIVIFGDADDYFSNNRISKSMELLAKNDIVVNDLSSVDETGLILDECIFSYRLENRNEINFEFIRDKNIFGLSNTAIKTELLKNIHFNTTVIALDWYIFSQVLFNHKTKAIFTNESITWYRQHAANIAGVNQNSKEKIKKDISVKKLHYQALSALNDKFRKEALAFQELEQNMKKNENELNQYIIKINQLCPKPIFWWENIIQ